MPKDHYVPQFYLRNFQIPSRPQWVFGYQRGCKATPKPIKSWAQLPDFERLSREAGGLKHDSVSKRLKGIENNVAPVIARLIGREDLQLSAKEWGEICLFVSSLISRGPSGRQESINLFQSMNIMRAKVMAENKEAFYATMRESGNRYTDDQIEEIRQKTLEFEKHYEIKAKDSFFKDYSLAMSLLAGELGGQCLLKKHPVLIKTISQKEFITSDNPVVFVCDEERYERGGGLGLENSLIYLAISPNRALLLVNRTPKKNVVTVPGEQVESFNSEVMTYARDSLFSRTYKKKIEEAFNKTVARQAETVIVENANRVILRVSGDELSE